MAVAPRGNFKPPPKEYRPWLPNFFCPKKWYHPGPKVTDMTFETEFELSQQDFEEIVKNHLYLRTTRRTMNIIRIIFATVLGVCATLLAIVGDIAWASFFGLFCLALIGMVVLLPRLAIRSLRNTPFYKDKVRVHVDDCGTRFIYASGDSNTQWSGYIRFQETNNLFLLYVSKPMFRPIPKRALSDEQVSEFREMLQNKIASPR